MHDPGIFSREPERTRRQPSFRLSTPQLGMLVFFVSASVLFGASLLAFVLTRAQNPDWRAGMPGLPPGLLGSTALVAGLCVSMRWALSSVRANRLRTLRKALWLALAFALAFLMGQLMNWSIMAQAELSARQRTLYPFTFFLLTGLHATHVVGGFVPHAIVLARVARRDYSSSRHEGIRLLAQYWDFLGAVWLVLLVTLWIFT